MIQQHNYRLKLGQKNNLVFRATVLKTLGRVSPVLFVCFFKKWNLNYKDPNKKKHFRKKKSKVGWFR